MFAHPCSDLQRDESAVCTAARYVSTLTGVVQYKYDIPSRNHGLRMHATEACKLMRGVICAFAYHNWSIKTCTSRVIVALDGELCEKTACMTPIAISMSEESLKHEELTSQYVRILHPLVSKACSSRFALDHRCSH